ncbi:MAG: signal recognition particle protein [Chloroflexi bacterium]|nr:signal recognition particle protein [Chloroflexota bacterium]
MFESLSEKLQKALGDLRRKGRLTEQDVNDALRQIRMVLLEADVNFKVVRDFVARVKERAIGTDILESLSAAQQVVKVVNDELIALLGSEDSTLNLAPSPPTVIMIVGLQGGGKTTTCGKLGLQFRKSGNHPLLVAADIYRPAAIKQLQVVGGQVNVPVFALGDKQDPVQIARSALAAAKEGGNDIIIFDTAGRLHIDDQMMTELKKIKAVLSPQEILLVVDAMTGQDAVNVAQQFNDQLGVTGFVLTKMDGDTRGGAALSIRSVTGRPIKFAGISEKMDGLEAFHPDRMASRILGMGDILSLIEKAEQTMDARKAEELEKKLRQEQLDFEDYLEQIRQINKIGSMDQIMSMLPGMGALKGKMPAIGEKDTAHMEAMILSMTVQERRHPEIINGSRRRRIAKGSGRTVQDVNNLITNFMQVRKMMKQITDMTHGGKRGKFRLPF